MLESIKKREKESSETKEDEGDIAQMVERSLSMREASGSIPDISTFFFFFNFLLVFLMRSYKQIFH